MRLIKTVCVAALLALVVVPAAFALRFTDDSYFMPQGYVGSPYSKQFNGAGGCGPALPYQYTLIGGALPPGLSLSFSGAISGTPTSAGSYSFWVNLSDQDPPSASWCRPSNAQREFTIGVSSSGGPVVVPPPTPVVVSTASVPNGEVNAAYATSLTASGGSSATKKWTVGAGQLPPGLALSSDGHITGMPTAAGTYSYTVTVVDGVVTSSKAFTVTIAPALTIAANPLVPNGEVRTPYSASVATILGLSGGAPPYRFTPVSGFPFGIGFDTKTGTIFGSPRQPGTLNLTISIADAMNVTRQVTLPLVVLPRLHIVPIDLHSGRAHAAYRAKVTVTGGLEPTWRISAGQLPAGLTLNPATGVIKGVPKRAGASSFTVSVKDSLGATVAIRYTIKIRH
jgi:hypothetical protein